MTDPAAKWRSLLAVAVVAAALVVASCEAPRPEPLSPGAHRTAPDPEGAPATPNVTGAGVGRGVTIAPGSPMPRYPDILRQAGVEGSVEVSFLVDEDGRADLASLRIIRSTHELFATAVKQVLPSMRFVAAETRGRKVKQAVTQPFTFEIAGNTSGTESSAPGTIHITGVSGKEPVLVRRREGSEASVPTVVILSSAGKEVRRIAQSGRLDEIKPADIQSIEVYKPSACPASAQAPCPLIRIVLKPGRDGAYRPK